MPRQRKTKLTPELQKKLLAFLRAGNYVETACRCCGLHKDTFYEWLKKAERGDKRYVEFAAAVEQAIAESEARDLNTIGMASRTQWQAAAWRLERRYPDRFGRFDRMKVEGKVDHDGGAALVAKLAKLIDGGAELKKRGRPPKEPSE